MKINTLNDRHYDASKWDSANWPISTGIEPEASEIPGGSTPSQYGLPVGATELQDLIEYRNLNFAMGNILKAAYRYGTCRHSDRRRDLHKIIWFANRELKRLDNEL